MEERRPVDANFARKLRFPALINIHHGAKLQILFNDEDIECVSSSGDIVNLGHFFDHNIPLEDQHYYHSTITLFMIGAFNRGKIDKDWDHVLHSKIPPLATWNGFGFIWILATYISSAPDNVYLRLQFHIMGDSPVMRTMNMEVKNSIGRGRDMRGQEVKLKEQQDTKTVGIVEKIIEARGCLKVKVGTEIGVVFTTHTNIPQQEYSIVSSANVFFGSGNTKRFVPISNISVYDISLTEDQNNFYHFQEGQEGKVMVIDTLSYKDIIKVYQHHRTRILTPIEDIRRPSPPNTPHGPSVLYSWNSSSATLAESPDTPTPLSLASLNKRFHVVLVHAVDINRHQDNLIELNRRDFMVIVLCGSRGGEMDQLPPDSSHDH